MYLRPYSVLYYTHHSTHLAAQARCVKEELSSSTSQIWMDVFLGLKLYIVNITQDKMEASIESLYDNAALMAVSDLSANSKFQEDNKVKPELQRILIPLKES